MVLLRRARFNTKTCAPYRFNNFFGDEPTLTFLGFLIKDKKPTPTGEDGLKDLEAIEKAYKNQISLN